MAICNIIDDPSRTPEQLEEITAHVRRSGPIPPDGCRLILLGVQRAITVWDTSEDRDSFLTERLSLAYEAISRSLRETTRTQFEVELLVAGDLAGMTPGLVGAEG
jgi:hypothetical protein